MGKLLEIITKEIMVLLIAAMPLMELKVKLRSYLDHERSEDEIYELSTQIDNLIVDYYKLIKK